LLQINIKPVVVGLNPPIPIAARQIPRSIFHAAFKLIAPKENGEQTAIRLSVHYTGSDEIEPRVLEGQTDVALTLEPEPSHPTSAGTVYESAGRLDYLLITPPRHELAHTEALHLHEIAKLPLVLGELKAYSRRRVQEVFHRHNLAKELNIAVETSSDEYTISCVRSGMGIGITLGIPRGRLYHGLKIRSLRRWFGMAGIGFLWQGGIHVPPIQREFSSEIQSSICRSTASPACSRKNS
jgi:DNA-binding transcriptional LysR family regulator